MTRSLEGRRVLVTRERPGELASLLQARGAHVVHVPLIAVVEPEDGGVELNRELTDLGSYDWLIVTSPAGAERVGSAVKELSWVRLAAVGSATSRVLSALADRSVDLVPAVQTGAALAGELVQAADGESLRVFVAQGDMADGSIVNVLRSAGHEVTGCVTYRTVLQVPDAAKIEHADALLLASGSAVRGWVRAVGRETPEVVVVIGPSTATVAEELGLKITSVAADHSTAGLVVELEHLFQS